MLHINSMKFLNKITFMEEIKIEMMCMHTGGQQLTPTLQVCPRCEHTSLWGQHWGRRVAAYTTTPTPAPELDPVASMFNSTLNSISAMPVYKDKSHEELRCQDHQSQGKTHSKPENQLTSGQPQLVLAVFVLPAMPTFSISGFGSVPWIPSLGSTGGWCSSTHSGTTVPAFAASPTFLEVPCTNTPVLTHTSSSTSVMPPIFPLCQMFRRL